MKSFIKVIKPVCAILFFITIAYVFYYRAFTDKSGGSTLNNDSKIIDGRYYISDNNGNIKEIEETEWNEHIVKAEICKFSVFYIGIYWVYICYKYFIIPNIKKRKE